MRRNLGFLLGTVTGACLTLAVTLPQGAHLVAAAKAAARADNIYSQLNLFGDVFERIKSDYVAFAYAEGTDEAGKRSVMDALSLYLNFINLFMLMLQFMGVRQQD